jgi:hypothetical protein
MRLAAAGWMMAFAATTCATAAEAIPVRMIDGLPVIEVQLGAIKADFLLDTGGQLAITVPPPLITAATGVSLGTEQRKMGDAAGNVFMVQSLVATSVKLGSVELGPVNGLVNYKWGLKIGAGDAPEVTNKGVIGLGALSSRNILLDLGAGRLSLFDRSAQDRPDLTGWRKVPFTYDKAGIVMQIVVDGLAAAMSLDTAATTSAISKGAALFAASASPCRGQPPATQFCGMKEFKQVRAGDGVIGSLTTAVVELKGVPFDGLLGIDFFLQRKVFIDFDARALFIREVPRPGSGR